MQKIMFDDRFGLTRAVIEGRKTMTRRAVKLPLIAGLDEIEMAEMETDWKCNYKAVFYAYDMEGKRKVCEVKPRYQVGEEVAVAQSYLTIHREMMDGDYLNDRYDSFRCYLGVPTEEHGWNNKQGVRADLMPYCIRITNIKIERLQDISEEDAMREGVFHYDKPPLHHESDRFAPWPPFVKPYKHDMDNLKYRATARYAFAYLIDKVSGGGTWKWNPWVFVYEFELIK